MAYSQLEPFGPDADGWRAGVIAATFANVMAGKKGRRTFQPQDFMPAEPLLPEEAARALQARIHDAMMAAGGRARGDKPRKRGRVQAESRPKGG